ncbi:hypothetical protein SLA2020_347550 [Shorea laevis]
MKWSIGVLQEDQGERREDEKNDKTMWREKNVLEEFRRPAREQGDLKGFGFDRLGFQSRTSSERSLAKTALDRFVHFSIANFELTKIASSGGGIKDGNMGRS